MRQESNGRNSVLVPAPQHGGRAEYTLRIAETIADRTGARILDIVRCEPHQPLYEQKLAGEANPELRLRLAGAPPPWRRHTGGRTGTGSSSTTSSARGGHGRPLPPSSRRGTGTDSRRPCMRSTMGGCDDTGESDSPMSPCSTSGTMRRRGQAGPGPRASSYPRPGGRESLLRAYICH